MTAFTVAALAQQVPAGASAAASVASSASAATSAVPGGGGEPGIELRRADSLQAPARGEAARRLPIILRAREVRGRPDLDAAAEGDVEFRRGGMVIHADKLTYDQAEDLARATGHVVVTRDGNVFSGPELQLKVERFEGFFRAPTYRFARTGAGGKARLIEFIDDQRATASDATYSSCTVEDGDGEPVWILKARELRIDNETNEGIARDAVLRFYGVPILASPVLSFPAQRGAQVRLPAAELRHRQPQRLPGGDPLLLEHRAQPRRDLHAAGKRSPRAVDRRRVPLSRAVVLRLVQREADAA